MADTIAHKGFNIFTWARNSFAAGVALVLPFLVTVWVVWTVVSFIDSHVVPLLPTRYQPLANAIPGAGVVFAVAALTLVGRWSATSSGASCSTPASA